MPIPNTATAFVGTPTVPVPAAARPTPPAPLTGRRGRFAAFVRYGGPPMLLASVAFAVTALGPGAGAGAGGIDAGLVPIVRFMAATKLVLALCVAAAAGLRYGRAGRRRRFVAGLVASLCMAAGAGLIWSAAGFGLAFAVFLTGAAIVGLLVMKELEASLRRRP